MRLAETVTFGGSDFDRAAELRGDAEAQARLYAAPESRVALLWRGRPMLDGYGTLARLAPDHPVFAEADDALFLGQESGRALFARELKGWAPEGQPLPEGGFADDSRQRHPELPDDHVFADLRQVMATLPARDAELAATARSVLGWHRSHRFCAACGAESRSAEAGWQRLCPVCGTRHFPRTDPVVIMLVTRGNSVLLGRSPRFPEGMFSLLAGFVEPGETIEAAVRREVFEETSVRVGEVDYLASQPWPFPSQLMLGCHGVAESTEIAVDPVEIAEAQWVSRERLMAVFAGEDRSLQPARAGAIAQFLLHNWLADRLD